MATVTLRLTQGLTIGDVQHREAELREYTAGDLIDAVDAAEKLVYTSDGPTLVASPGRVDLELLCRQVVRVGDHKGPLAMTELRRLSGADLALLQAAARQLDAGGMAAAAGQQRGRADGSEGRS